MTQPGPFLRAVGKGSGTMSQHRKTPGYPQYISADYVRNVSWCVFFAFVRLVDRFLLNFCGCFWSFARNFRAVSGGKLCTTGTSDIELSTVGKRVKISFQRYQARHLAWVWRRNSKKKVDENRTFFEVWNLVFVRKKNSIGGNRGTFFMNRVYFDVDFLMQPSRFACATVFLNSIG